MRVRVFPPLLTQTLINSCAHPNPLIAPCTHTHTLSPCSHTHPNSLHPHPHPSHTQNRICYTLTPS